ncbi:MAG: peptidase [Nitrosopumilus sp.]|nr:peptidase [Nitrosopumilus sp.]
MISKIILLILVGLVTISITPAYAQHHSGALAPPIDFDGLRVALTTILTPEDFVYGDSKSANLSIRFFDSETNKNIQSVTYRVQIFHEGTLVANEYFFDDDGKLDLEIKPTSVCYDENLWKCTKYYGEKHAIAGAYYARGNSLPVIQGPVFDKSGQYNIQVSIVGATNPKTMTAKDLLFETFLHLPEKYTFPITIANAQEFPISIKSHNDEISNFNYDESTNKISYEIFHDFSEHHHDSSINQIVLLQKDFPHFKQGYDVDVFVEGIQIKDNYFDFEISNPDQNIVRINIPNEEFLEIKNQINFKNDNNQIKIEILPGVQIDLNELDFIFENGINAKVSWDSKLKTGEKIPLTFSFFDVNNKPAKDILFAYSITDSSGKEIWSNIGISDTYLGILTPHGIYQESVEVSVAGQYQLKIILIGHDSNNFEKYFTSKSDFSLNFDMIKENKTEIVPSWIKNNAGWWADGIVGDQEFIQSIEFLINENIINIPVMESKSTDSQEIPSWIKNNAGWWADDLISESDFVKGIEFLISQGVIN